MPAGAGKLFDLRESPLDVPIRLSEVRHSSGTPSGWTFLPAAGRVVLNAESITNGSQKPLTIGGATAAGNESSIATATRFILPAGRAVGFKVRALGRSIAGAQSRYTEWQGVAVNVAGTITVSSLQEIGTAVENASFDHLDVEAAADNTNKAISFSIAGPSSYTNHYTVEVEFLEN